MAKRIRVVETVVYDYEPDYSENSYASQNIDNVEAALKADKDEYDAGRVFLGELCYNLPTRSAVWEIYDDHTG